jgi:DNA methylase
VTPNADYVGHPPYYDDGRAVIIHADCRDVGPLGEVLVTDPPYGVDFVGKHWKKTSPTGGYTTPDSDIGPAVVAAYLPAVRRAAVFPGIRQLHDYPKPDDIGCVFNPAGAGFGRWGFSCLHPVLFYGKPRHNVQPASLLSFDQPEPNGHPCPKPLAWIRWLVEMASEPGDLIADPFMGSGTTLVAAVSAGRRAIGVEIEERYCEIAARRLNQGVLDLEYALSPNDSSGPADNHTYRDEGNA